MPMREGSTSHSTRYSQTVLTVGYAWFWQQLERVKFALKMAAFIHFSTFLRA